MTKTTKISIILAVIIFLMPLSYLLIEHFFPPPCFFSLLYLFLIILFFILIVRSISQLKIESNSFKGTAHIWVPVIIVVLSLALIFPRYSMRIDTYDMSCMSRLHGIYVSFDFYKSGNNQKYPNPSKWCELLLDKKFIFADQLICPARHNTGERCSYAMNPDCEPNSPGDVVLLFEGKKPDWNQYGGAELINPESHSRRNWFWGYWYSGCCVLFNDGQTKFVAAKDFKNLRWK